jgi:hypothetical protein
MGQQPWQEGMARHEDYFFGGAYRVPSRDFHGENQGLIFIGST